MFAHRRLALCVFALLTGVLAPAADAAVVYQQALASNWNTGYCSPCSFGAWRGFASFTLNEYTLLTGADFAVLDSTWTTRQDISVSIWDTPSGSKLFGSDFAQENVTHTGSASKYVAGTDLDSWALGPGTYWISLLGINGNVTSWGSDGTAGDDARYSNGNLFSGTANFGFSLYGTAGQDPTPVPAPGTLWLLLGGGGLVFALRRRRSL